MSDSQTKQNRLTLRPVDESEAIAVFESDDLSMLILEVETGRIVDANAAAIRLFDLPSEYGDLNLSAYLSLTPDQILRYVAGSRTAWVFGISRSSCPVSHGSPRASAARRFVAVAGASLRLCHCP